MEDIIVVTVSSDDVASQPTTLLNVPSVASTSVADGGPTSQKKYLLDKESVEYKKRRERNNVAVRKSRTKSKQKNEETLKKINKLKTENAKLESRAQLLSKELCVLKDLFLSHAQDLPEPSITYNVFNSNAPQKIACSESGNTPKQPVPIPHREEEISSKATVEVAPIAITEAVVPMATSIIIQEVEVVSEPSA